MRVLFVTVYDPENSAVRFLTGALQKYGHKTHILQLKSLQKNITCVANVKASLLAYSNGSLMGCPELNPITSMERALFAETVACWCPDFIGFGAWEGIQSLFPVLASVARAACPSAFVAAFDFRATGNPEFFLRNGADVVVRGEADDVLPELLEAIQGKQSWHTLQNLSYLCDNHVCNTSFRILERDISRYSMAWHGTEGISNIENNTCTQAPMGNVGIGHAASFPRHAVHCLSSRTCCEPYLSDFAKNLLCRNACFASRKRRVRSMDHFFAELCDIKQHGADFIYIQDDFFVRPRKLLHAFLDRYSEEIALPFHAYFHPVQLLRDTTLIPKIIKAGCVQFTFCLLNRGGAVPSATRQYAFLHERYPELFSVILSYGGTVSLQFVYDGFWEEEVAFEETLKFIRRVPHESSGKDSVAINNCYIARFPEEDLPPSGPGSSVALTVPDFYLRSLLMDIRHTVSDRSFSQIVQDNRLAASPERLGTLRKILQHDAYHAYIFSQRERLRGREVYFWGCGEMYMLKKHLFSACRPRGILVDFPYSGPSFVDGIPVLHPDAVLRGGDVLPIILFSGCPEAIYWKILTKYPQHRDIVFCSSL